MHIYIFIYMHIYVGGMSMNAMGMSIHPFPIGIFIFWHENTFITQLLMMSLCYITNDIIDPLSNSINKCVLDSEVHNTARSQ